MTVTGVVLGLSALILWTLAYRWGYADARFDTRYGITGQPTWPFADTEPETEPRDRSAEAEDSECA